MPNNQYSWFTVAVTNEIINKETADFLRINIKIVPINPENTAMANKFTGLEEKARMKFAEGGVVDDLNKNFQQQSNVINQAAQNANQSMYDTEKAYQ